MWQRVKGWRKFIALCLLIIGLSSCERKVVGVVNRVAAPEAAPNNYTSLGEFAPTFYRILDESAEEWPAEDRTENLLKRRGELIAKVAPAFKRQLDIEGSARLRDGRIVNFDQKIAGSWNYTIAVGAPYGLGEDGYKLIPYRTLAVDPGVVKLGTVLYVPALAGLKLPSGEVHDGLFFAHDTGQGIEGHRIDVFVGFENDVDNTLTRSERIRNMEPVRVYQVDEQTAERLRTRFKTQFEHVPST